MSRLSTVPFKDIPIGGPTFRIYRLLMIGEEGVPPNSKPEIVGGLGAQPLEGSGSVDFVINNLGREFHMTDQGDDGIVRKSQYCGPGTDIAKRLARGDPGINELDHVGYKPHDIWYRDHKTAKERHIDDIRLAKVADRIANDPSKLKMQRSQARIVNRVMRGKVFLGLGAQPDGFADLATKALSWGIDKLIEKGIKRKATKSKIKVLPTVAVPTNLKPLVPSSKIDLTAHWDGSNILLYKKNGAKKTRKELEEELYLGIVPHKGAGKRRRGPHSQ